MMDGVTILNEVEVITQVNGTFNFSAAVIASVITLLICGIVGFFTDKTIDGVLLSVIVCLVPAIFVGAICGLGFSNPPETETTIQYEVTLDDSVSMNEFYEHYNVIEQRGKIYVVEEKNIND